MSGAVYAAWVLKARFRKTKGLGSKLEEEVDVAGDPQGDDDGLDDDEATAAHGPGLGVRDAHAERRVRVEGDVHRVREPRRGGAMALHDLPSNNHLAYVPAQIRDRGRRQRSISDRMAE